MSVPRILRHAASLVIATVAIASLIGTTSSMAEVSVFPSDFGGPPTILIAGNITDNPDPVGFWLTFRPQTVSRRILNPDGDANGDGPPTFVRDSFTGAPIVAWAKNVSGDRDIVLSRFDNGDWTLETTIVGGAGDQLDPSLAVDPVTGDLHLVYWVEGATPRVLHRQAPADLSSWSAPQQISAPGEIALRPSAEFHDGALRVAYEVHDGGRDTAPRRIELASVTSTSVVREVVAYSQHAEPNWAQVHAAADRIWIDWVDDAELMGWRRCVVGVWNPVSVEGFSGVEEQEFQVREVISTQANQ